MPEVASVAVEEANLLFDKPYSYRIPPEMASEIRPGRRVRVPFGRNNRLREAVVLGVGEYDGQAKLKSIAMPGSEEISFDESMLKLALWLRKRTYCPLYDVFRAMIPAAVTAADKTVRFVKLEEGGAAQNPGARWGEKTRKALTLLKEGPRAAKEIEYLSGVSPASLKTLAKRGIVSFFEEVPEETKGSLRPPRAAIPEIPLAPKQEEIYLSLQEKAFRGECSFALLYGVTGSGKTHVYIKLIADVIRSGKSALILVPEIALTPQMIERFYRVFGDRVATLHSGLSDGERRREWLRIKRGDADVVIGTRSAVFAPIPESSLGVIIIDEEHESSYKSESSPRYHARDVAKYRASKAGILLLLGSATPSMESEYLARRGDYARYELAERYQNRSLAEVTIVDRKEDLRRGNENAVGSFLAGEIRKTKERGEQTILFLNRRGRNRRLICTDCGASVECPHCSSPMSYHATSRRLHCHICGYTCQPPNACPACGESHLMLDRAGTQKIEEEIEALIPGATYLRMDADTTGSRYAHTEILNRFRDEKIDVLIGTQMITKGLDFPNVTLVGVLDADMSLYSPDFHASERTFSLLTQVVGRSGRGEKKGRAVIQTYSPQNAVLLAAERQDYKSFYESEISLRKALFLPPFSSILLFLISGEDEEAAGLAAERFGRRLRGAVKVENATVLGPAPAMIYKANNRFRWTLTLRTADLRPLRRIAEGLQNEFLKQKENRKILLTIDENPCDVP